MLAVAVGTRMHLYDVATGCGDTAVRLVGLDNQGNPIDPYCEETLGGRDDSLIVRNAFNAVTLDGRQIVFTANVGLAEKSNGCVGRVAANPKQVFARLGGSRTIEISRPLGVGAFGGCGDGGAVGEIPGEVPCPGAATRPPAVFWGASEDGSKIFFTTAAPLVEEDKDTTRDLYEATIGCLAADPGCGVSEREVISLSRLTQATSPAEAADVRGVVRIAPDGSHVAFVASGVLSDEPGAEGRVAVKGANNLYVYDNEIGEARFVAELCSGPGKSGQVADARCPSELHEAPGSADEPVSSEGNDTHLWSQGQETKEAQFNICGMSEPGACTGARETGRFLVFASYARLLKSDTDDARDVYRYDIANGVLDRVSGGEEGFGANGNCDEATGETVCDATIAPTTGVRDSEALYAQHEMVDRSIGEDGSQVVFATASALSPAASNGLENIYEWDVAPGSDEGGVSILSTGSSLTADMEPVITPSGRDVFFSTSQGLVRQDIDGQSDVYDARIGGGFPTGPAELERCSADACQGPLTDPAPLLVPGSVSQEPGGNFSPPPSKAAVKAAVKSKAAKSKKPKAKRGSRSHKASRRQSKLSRRQGGQGWRGR